jgi:hypothetical protein
VISGKKEMNVQFPKRVNEDRPAQVKCAVDNAAKKPARGTVVSISGYGGKATVVRTKEIRRKEDTRKR